MSKGKTAKTGSKNNPQSRASAKEFFFGGKKVVPVKFVSESRSYIAAAFENGEMPTDNAGQPLPWAKVSN